MSVSAAVAYSTEGGHVGTSREAWLTRNRDLAPPLTGDQRAIAVRIAAGVARRPSLRAEADPSATRAQPGRGRSASPSAA